MQPVISIIMPAYNSQSFIRKAIEACLSQTYSNFELIIINDGSTDKTGAIIDEYAKRDNRIKCKHINNAGASNARNTGLKLAQGKYVHFCDSDDFIEKEMYEKMIASTLNFEYDLICCGMTLEYSSGRKIERITKLALTKYECKDASGFVKGFNILFENNNTLASTCNKLFKRESLINFDITFDTSLRNREDTKFCYSFLTKANSMFFVESPFYHYLSRGQDVSLSDTFAPHSIETANFLINCITKIIKRMNIAEEEILNKSIYYTSGLLNENAVWLKDYCKNTNAIEVVTILEQILLSSYTKTIQTTTSGKLLLSNHLIAIYSLFMPYIKDVAKINIRNYFEYLIVSKQIENYFSNNNFLPIFLIHQELKDEKQFDLAALTLISLLNNKNNINKIPHYSLEEYLSADTIDSITLAQAKLMQNSDIVNYLTVFDLQGIITYYKDKTDFNSMLLQINCLILSCQYEAALKLCWNIIFEFNASTGELIAIKKKITFIAESFKTDYNDKIVDFIFNDSNMLNYIKDKDYTSAYNHTLKYIKANSSLYNIYIYNILQAKIASYAKNINYAAQGYIEGVLSPLNKNHDGKDEFIEFLKENKLNELLNELEQILNN